MKGNTVNTDNHKVYVRVQERAPAIGNRRKPSERGKATTGP